MSKVFVVVLALTRLRQEDGKFKASLRYLVRPYFEKQKQQ
jgi:hypothetical protein